MKKNTIKLNEGILNQRIQNRADEIISQGYEFGQIEPDATWERCLEAGPYSDMYIAAEQLAEEYNIDIQTGLNYLKMAFEQYEPIEVRHELLVRIKDYLKDRTNEDPVLTGDLELTLGEAEACGLSSLELPEVSSLFLDEFGDPCYTVHGSEETYPAEDMSLTDLRKAEEYLRKRQTSNTTRHDA